MADFDPKMIEALRNALSGTCAANLCRISVADPIACPCSLPVFEILRALPISPDALNALWRGNPTRGTDEVLSAGNAASPYARKDKP